jgi:hypothetical protein
MFPFLTFALISHHSTFLDEMRVLFGDPTACVALIVDVERHDEMEPIGRHVPMRRMEGGK